MPKKPESFYGPILLHIFNRIEYTNWIELKHDMIINDYSKWIRDSNNKT